MNEHDLLDLVAGRRGPAMSCRPVDEVVTRGATLRRRRHAVRAAGITAIVGAVAATAALLVQDGPDTSTMDRTPHGVPHLEPAPSWICEREDTETAVDVEAVDGLRLLPTWLPDGVDLAGAEARQVVPGCPYIEPALSLLLVDGETIRGSMTLHGPYATPPEMLSPPDPVNLRGVRAAITVADTGFQPPAYELTWAEPDGGHWKLTTDGIALAQLRTFAEAFILDSRPDSGPVAVLPGDALPNGWVVVYQAPAQPELQSAAAERWTVTTNREECSVTASSGHGDVPPGAYVWTQGDLYLRVRGHDAVARSFDNGADLRWAEAPGIHVSVYCTGQDLDTVKQIAESLELVEPGDPRIPPLR